MVISNEFILLACNGTASPLLWPPPSLLLGWANSRTYWEGCGGGGSSRTNGITTFCYIPQWEGGAGKRDNVYYSQTGVWEHQSQVLAACKSYISTCFTYHNDRYLSNNVKKRKQKTPHQLIFNICEVIQTLQNIIFLTTLIVLNYVLNRSRFPSSWTRYPLIYWL